MASENIKITIQEVDKTKPGGSGIAPSDIAFVPGFSNLPSAPKNIPTLCNDYIEFENLFGKTPRVLSTRDVTGYEQYGFLPGSFDKSYIYAKELLFQGMPVIYSNIVDDEDVYYFDFVPENGNSFGDNFKDYFKSEYDKTNGQLKLTAIQSFTGDENYKLKTTVKVAPSNNNVPTVTTFTVEGDFVKNPVGAVIEGIKVAGSLSPKSKTAGVQIVNIGDKDSNVIEITNTTNKEQEIDIIVTLSVKMNIDLDFDDSELIIRLFDHNASCLNVFYGDADHKLILNQLELVKDKSVYSVKYLTSGGYPSVVSNDEGRTALLPFANDLLSAAEFRGDAVALIDYQRAENEVPFDVDPDSHSFYAKMQQEFNGQSNGEYGAMFYPWGEYSCGASLSNVDGLDSNDVYMPASFSYMMCVAKAIKTSPNWLAMAGVSRGIVPKLNKICTPNNVLSNTIAEEMQPKFGIEGHNLSINCITNIRPYGLTLWGNRTMKAMNKEGAVALNFLNIRNMLSDIKKVLYTTAKSLMFEQNSDTLWLRFKAGITPLLNQLKTGQGISDYQIVRGTRKYNGDPLQKGEMAAVVKIYPLYAVEYFELTVELNDEDVIVS